MIGLIDRAIEEFLRATYGDDLVRAIVADLSTAVGRPLPDLQGQGRAGIGLAARHLSKSTSELLEDLGGWMTRIEPVRRLLRFSGRDFRDFVVSLEEMPGRADLIVPMLALPQLRVMRDRQEILIELTGPIDEWQPILVGLIRGMADDYGALCLILSQPGSIRVDICDEWFAQGRQFRLQGDILAGQVAL